MMTSQPGNQSRLPEASTASVPTLLAVFAAEASWIYLVMTCLFVPLHARDIVGPEVVVAPYGAGACVTLVISAWTRFGRSLARKSLKKVEAGSIVKVAGAVLRVAFPASAAAFYLLLGLLVVPSVVSLHMPGSLPMSFLPLPATDDVTPSPDDVSLGAWLALLGAALWVRGTVLASGDPALPSPLSRLVPAAAGLLVIVLSGAADGMGAEPPLRLPGTFLLAASLAVLFSRLDRPSSEGRQPGRWFWGTGAVALCLVAVGVGLGYIVAISLAEPARLLWDSFAGAAFPLLAQFWAWLAGLFGQPQSVVVAAEPTPPSLPGDRLFFTMPVEIRDLGRWFFNASWIAAIFIAIFSNLSRWLTKDRAQNRPAARENLRWSIRGMLKHFLLSIVLLLARRWPRVLRLLRGRSRDEQAGTMQELYRDLLRWSARRGLTDEPWTTPREHKAKMASLWPHLEPDFALVTECYLQVRYGATLLDEAQLEAGLMAFRRIASLDGAIRGHKPEGR